MLKYEVLDEKDRRVRSIRVQGECPTESEVFEIGKTLKLISPTSKEKNWEVRGAFDAYEEGEYAGTVFAFVHLSAGYISHLDERIRYIRVLHDDPAI